MKIEEVSAFTPDYSYCDDVKELTDAKEKMEQSIKIFGNMGLPTHQTESHLRLVNERLENLNK